MRRRALLATGVGAATTGLSGCLSVLETGVQLAGVSVANYHDEPAEIDVSIRQDETGVQAAALELPAAENAGVEPSREPVACDWGDDHGAYVVDARQAGETETFDLTDRVDDESCVYAELEVYGTPEDMVLTTTPCDRLAPARREPPWGCGFLES